MSTDKTILKSWFITGEKPTQDQFWAWMDSYYHKNELLSMNAVYGLENALANKAEASSLQYFAIKDGSNITNIEDWKDKLNINQLDLKKANKDASELSQDNITAWKSVLNVGELPENVATNDGEDDNGDPISGTSYTKEQSDEKYYQKVAPQYFNSNYVLLADGTTKAAGDLGKNVANSSLTSIAGAGLTLGADWAINTAGLSYSITGLSDVSNNTAFNTLLSQNAAGRIGKTNGKQPFLNLPTMLSDAEKTNWKTQMNGGWTTNTMSVGLISPPIINKALNSNTWIVLKGANLNLPPTSFGLEIMNEAGNTVLATVPNAQIQLYQNGIDLTFYYNFHSLANGNYRIRLWNGVAYYVTSLTIQVTDTLRAVDLGLLNWNVKTYNDATSSVIYGDGPLARITPDAAVKPLAEGPDIIASVKSNVLFGAGQDFYLRFNISYNDTSTTNADTFIGLMAESTPNSLSNNNFLNFLFDSFIVHYTAVNFAFNGTPVESTNTGSLSTKGITIIRKGITYSVIIETQTQGTKFFSLTNTSAAVALCMLGTNSQRAYQFSVAIQEAYLLN
ncbi:hypothetical protein [Chryseobacterium limigenitum]|uniref:Uncharacterized protein n=1 Tax=Chryseobacterium limigenitum TaxID=1612149 RepID=A0A1K2IS63_9FLAO|nr:hypothetical protein [Chryseobacterium limigenitum]SFZ95150.1 hypothetical protein SAMN05216324_108170 [Chryseobacterium limigenitum]